jgi:hypothetical protein
VSLIWRSISVIYSVIVCFLYDYDISMLQRTGMQCNYFLYIAYSNDSYTVHTRMTDWKRQRVLEGFVLPTKILQNYRRATTIPSNYDELIRILTFVVVGYNPQKFYELPSIQSMRVITEYRTGLYNTKTIRARLDPWNWILFK